MSETKGPQRLGKAALTLGVSKDTIVEFLSKKGVSVDNNPMAKIEADAYELLLGEFAGDQAAKEKSAATAAKVRESRATITLEDTKKQKGSTKEDEEPEKDRPFASSQDSGSAGAANAQRRMTPHCYII